MTPLQACDLKKTTANINTNSLNISHGIILGNVLHCFHVRELYMHEILGYLETNKNVNILNLFSE